MFRTVTNITLFKGKINDICHKYEKTMLTSITYKRIGMEPYIS